MQIIISVISNIILAQVLSAFTKQTFQKQLPASVFFIFIFIYFVFSQEIRNPLRELVKNGTKYDYYSFILRKLKCKIKVVQNVHLGFGETNFKLASI
jgi:hypothetical protein